MGMLIAFSPFIFAACFYAFTGILHAAYIKLSAQLLRTSFVSWKYCLIFAFAMTLLTAIVQVMPVMAGAHKPLAPSLLVSLALNMTLGGWFFGTKNITRRGQPFGWIGGMQLATLSFAFLDLTSILSSGILHLPGPSQL